jgi:hypothetical protein
VASGEGQLKVQGWNLWQIRISYRLSTGTLRKSQSPIASAPEAFANFNLPSLQRRKPSQIPIPHRFGTGNFRKFQSPIASTLETFANPDLQSLQQRNLSRVPISNRFSTGTLRKSQSLIASPTEALANAIFLAAHLGATRLPNEPERRESPTFGLLK